MNHPYKIASCSGSSEGFLLMVQKSQGQPPGMFNKNRANNGINYQPQLVNAGFCIQTGSHLAPLPLPVLGLYGHYGHQRKKEHHLWGSKGPKVYMGNQKVGIIILLTVDGSNHAKTSWCG